MARISNHHLHTPTYRIRYICSLKYGLRKDFSELFVLQIYKETIVEMYKDSIESLMLREEFAT